MAPAGNKGKAVAPLASVAPTELALLPSHASKTEDLGLMLQFMAGHSHEWRETNIWPGSATPRSLVRFAYPFFLHSVYVGLVPPFHALFYTTLSHYQILALHLQPNSGLLLSIFPFYFEAFRGVRP
ncbi:hypothetical protein D1007_32958 [Hordeum vulgare]|nr:hypothetical protein D1007_32958 [Hordeum vulgare]